MLFQPLNTPDITPNRQSYHGTPYRIQPGDTFIGLGKRFGYTLDALLSYNPGLNPRCLEVGQEICLPPSPGCGPFPCGDGSVYIVQSGDTLCSIARRFGYLMGRLMDANPHVDNPDRLEAETPIYLPYPTI